MKPSFAPLRGAGVRSSRVLVIGCGYAGEQHAHGFVAAQGSDLVAVCDLDETRAVTLARKIGATAYTSFEEALVAEAPDIVAVATDEYHHVEPCLAALEAGAHVFCEKMMAHTLHEGERMVRAAQEAGRTLGVNFNYRSVPSYLHLRDCLRDGELGPARLLVAHTHAFLWHHVLDLIRFLLGDFVRVQASILEDTELRKRTYHWKNHEELLYIPSDHVTATFEFPSGGVASVSASAWIPFAEQWFSLSVYCRDGAAHINHAVAENLAGLGGPGRMNRALAAFPPFTVADSFKASIASFVEAVKERRPPPASGEDGLAAMRMEEAVVRASQHPSHEEAG
jgi:predicted dehydrogenase